MRSAGDPERGWNEDGGDSLLVVVAVVVKETHCYLFLVDEERVGIERSKAGKKGLYSVHGDILPVANLAVRHSTASFSIRRSSVQNAPLRERNATRHHPSFLRRAASSDEL